MKIELNEVEVFAMILSSYKLMLGTIEEIQDPKGSKMLNALLEAIDKEDIEKLKEFYINFFALRNLASLFCEALNAYMEEVESDSTAPANEEGGEA